MPEIKNVIPGEEELYAYYRASHPDPASRDFAGFEDIEELRSDLGVQSIFARLIR